MSTASRRAVASTAVQRETARLLHRCVRPVVEVLESRRLLTVFPLDSGLVDVTASPYFADKTGATDDTAILQKAIVANLVDNPSNKRTLYFPAGTYLINSTLKWERPISATVTAAQQWSCWLNFQGADEGTTIIKAKAGTFSTGEAMIMTGSRDDPGAPLSSIYNRSIGEGNEAFHNNIQDITVDTGTSNPGAVGIDWLANNEAVIRNVTVRSGAADHSGSIGISMLRQTPGPGLLDNVTIDGFNEGIAIKGTEYSMTMENLTLTNQKIIGINNSSNVLNIENLNSTDTVPAISNNNSQGLITIIDSTMNGGASGNWAIDNQGTIMGRDLDESGYKGAIGHGASTLNGPHISEYESSSTISLSSTPSSPATSLNLPIEQTPIVPFDPNLADWVNGDGKSPNLGLQAAMNSGASTVYLPPGAFTVSTTIHIGAGVTRIWGADSVLSRTGSGPIFEFDAGTAATVIIQGIHINGQILDNSSRTLVIEDCEGFSYTNTALGTGNVFMEDVVAGAFSGNSASINIAHPQDIWARHLNTEVEGTKIINNGGQLWVLGIKTEKHGTILDNMNSAKSEILGGLYYGAGDLSTMTPAIFNAPAFINNNSSMSLTVASSEYNANQSFGTIVEEIRGNLTQTLLPSHAGLATHQGSQAGKMMALFTGYVATSSSGPTAAYGMNEDAGTTISDSSGNNNTGTFQGSPTWFTPGKSGTSALSFNGSTAYVSVPSTASDSPTSAMTIAAWVNRSSTGPDSVDGYLGIDKTSAYRLVAVDPNAPSSRWEFAITDSNGTLHQADSTTSFSNDVWHYVVGTYDGTTLTLYVDGTQAASLAFTGKIKASTSPLEIGRRDGTRYFPGQIDELKIYNRALSSSEVLANYNSYGVVTVPAAPTNLTAIPASTTEIDLQWTDNATNEDAYKIQRSTDGVNFTQIAALDPGVTTFSDNTFTGTTLYYRVFAANTAGNSANATAPEVVLTPMAAWSMDEQSGATINDSTGNGNTGTLHGATFALPGRAGASALAFDGVSGYASVPSTTALSFSNAMTISAWFNQSTTGGYAQTGIDKTSAYRLVSVDTGASSRFQFFLYDTSGVFHMAQSIQSYSTGTWHYVVGTYDGGNLNLYVDGQLAATTVWTGTIRATTTEVDIGRRDGIRYYAGEIDELKLYNWARSASDIAADFSSYTILPPAAPTTLIAAGALSDQISISWTDNSTNEDGFDIERSTDNITFTQVGTAGPGDTDYDDTGLSPSTLYYYRVRAFNSGGNSAYTNTVSDTTSPLAPAAPSNLATTVVSFDQINLTWTDNSTTEDGFNIERSFDNLNFNPLATVAANVTSYSDIGLSGNTTLYYRIYAFNSGGISVDSATASAYTGPNGAWSMNEGTGTTVGDSSPDGNTGTTVGTPTWLAGEVGSSLSFNGSSQYVSIPTSASLNVTAAVTISGWFKQSTTGGGGNSGVDRANAYRIVAVEANAPSSHWQFLIKDSGSVTHSIQSSSTYTNGAWHYVVGTYDGTTLSLYVDGALAASTAFTGTIRSNTSALEIGRRDGSVYFAGQIDEVQVFGRAKPASEILNDYNSYGPVAPSGLTATPTSATQVNLAWTDNSNNETGFKIERSTDGVTYTQINTVGANVVVYSDTGLTTNTHYFYRVRATNSSGDSAYSQIASATTLPVAPAAPSALAATVISAGEIDLTWTDNSSNEDSFSIERSTDGVNFIVAGSVVANTTAFADIGLSAQTAYTYRIRAINAGGNSAYTSTVSGTTLAIIPQVPSGLTATTISATQINLAWTDNSSNETGFKIERSTDGVNFTQINTVAVNVVTYNDTGLTAATQYTYRIRAYNTGGNSAYTSLISATTLPLAPAAPTNLALSVLTASQVVLTWTDNSAENELGFKIDRSTDGTTFTPLGSVNQDVTTYTDATIGSNATVYYRVYAYNAGGNSGFTSVASVRVAPTGAWALNETSGSTTADSSGNGDTGTLVNSPVSVAGKLGNAFSFNGSNQYITIPSTSNINPSAAMTISGWFKRSSSGPDSVDGWMGIDKTSSYRLVAIDPNAPSSRWEFSITDVAGTAHYCDSTTSYTNDVWHYVVGTFDGQNLKLYVDGTLSATLTLGAGTTIKSTPTTALEIGRRDSLRYFPGVIDDVKVYNRAKAATEISSDFTTYGTITTPAAPSGLATTVVSSTQVNLAWTDNSTNEDAFRIERSSDGVTFTQIAAVGANVTTYSDTNLGGATTLYYRIRSSNTAGDSAYTTAVIARQGLVGSWSMNENTGSTINDSTANHNNGTLINGPTWSPGISGSALNFNGSNSYVSIASSASLNVSSAMSIGAWFDQSSTGGFAQTGIDKTGAYRLVAVDTGASSRFQFYVTDSVTGVTHQAQSTAFFNTNQWHYVVGTYDGANLKLYVDGVLQATTAYTGTIATNNTALEIGRRDSLRYFAGEIDEVSVLKRALTAAEILNDYNLLA